MDCWCPHRSFSVLAFGLFKSTIKHGVRHENQMKHRHWTNRSRTAACRSNDTSSHEQRRLRPTTVIKRKHHQPSSRPNPNKMQGQNCFDVRLDTRSLCIDSSKTFEREECGVRMSRHTETSSDTRVVLHSLSPLSLSMLSLLFVCSFPNTVETWTRTCRSTASSRHDIKYDHYVAVTRRYDANSRLRVATS